MIGLALGNHDAHSSAEDLLDFSVTIMSRGPRRNEAMYYTTDQRRFLASLETVQYDSVFTKPTQYHCTLRHS
jgi:hypothetical protein